MQSSHKNLDFNGKGNACDNPKLHKEESIGLLEDAKGGNWKVNREIGQIVEIIQKSLKERYWKDSFHLQPSLGSLFVFAKERVAVDEMARDLGICGQRSEFKTLPPAVREVFTETSGKLVQADKLLALRSLEDARGRVTTNPRKQHMVDKMIERAEDQYKEGLASLEKECVSEKGGWWKKQPGEVAAISHFERSWLFSRLAQQVAGGWWHRDMDSLDVDHKDYSRAWGDMEIERYERGLETE